MISDVNSSENPAAVARASLSQDGESTTVSHRPLVTVAGEAVVDLISRGDPGWFHARPGGSPLNVAVALARLGHRTSLMARLADTAFGRLLRRHAAAEGVELEHVVRATEPATLAVVEIDEAGQPRYDFYDQGTADWQWTAAEASACLHPDTAVFHLGSAASWLDPSRIALLEAAAGMRQGRALVSYDPNIRPTLLGDRMEALSRVEDAVAVAHLVKASREDVEWLYPQGLEEAAERWLALGALLVVVTDGPHGARIFRPGHAAQATSGRRVKVADTVGAGDAFTAGLLSGLMRRGLHTPVRLANAAPAHLAAAVDDAVLVSALTCQRVGADPPTIDRRFPLPGPEPLDADRLSFAPTHRKEDL